MPNSDASKGFVDGNASGTDYAYDANGNLTRDNNKGISIEYNHQNKPKTIIFDNGNRIEWLYDAAGIKLRKTAIGSTGSETTDYLGGIEYMNNAMTTIYHSEGRAIVGTSGAMQYEYVLKDHLGSGRVWFSDANDDGVVDVSHANPLQDELMQEEHYYPYGLRMDGSWSGYISAHGVDEQRQFNGVEFEQWLGWNVMPHRTYDPALGRFGQVDPLAESYQSMSTYHFVMGNPMKYRDPTGMGAEGDYYGWNGEYLGNDGINDRKVYVADAVVKENSGRVINATNSKLLPVNINQFNKILGKVYGETSLPEDGFSWKEAAGVTDVIQNRADRRESVLRVSKEKAYDLALSSGIYGDAKLIEEAISLGPASQYYKKAKDVTHAVVVALATKNSDLDFSNGAMFWQGNDLPLKDYTAGGTIKKENNAYHKYYLTGLRFSSPEHNIWKLKDHKSGNLQYDYTYETTTTYGLTTFMRFTNEYKLSVYPDGSYDKKRLD